MDWEKIDEETTRLEVSGGWIYKTVERGKGSGVHSTALCFVPDPAVAEKFFDGLSKRLNRIVEAIADK